MKRFLIYFCAIMILLSDWGFGQNKTPPENPKNDPKNNTSKEPKKEAEAKDKSPEKKQSPFILERNFIYIPYENFSAVLQGDPQGAFLPSNYLQELLAFQFAAPQASPQPGIPYGLTKAAYKGKLEGDLLSLEGEISFQVFHKGWVKIPLRLPQGAFTALDLKGLYYLLSDESGYSLMVQGPGIFLAKANLFYNVEKKEELRTLVFQGPSTAQGTFQLSLPGKKEVFVEGGLMAAPTFTKDETQIALFLGPQSSFNLSWKEKKKELPPQKPQMETLSIVQSTYSLEGEQHKITVRFEVFGGSQNHFSLKFPGEYEYSFLQGANLSVIPDPENAGKQKKLNLQLNQPVTHDYTFVFQLEKRYLELPAQVQPPFIEIEGARQERGYFTLYSAGEAEATPAEYSGFTRTSFEPIQSMVSPSSPYVFFFSRLGDKKADQKLAYKLEKKKPEIEPSIGLLSQLEEKEIRLLSRISLKIRKAKLLSFSLKLPYGYDTPKILSGNGKIEKVAESADKGESTFEVVLSQAASDAVTLEMETHRAYPDFCPQYKTLSKKEEIQQHIAKCPVCQEGEEYKNSKAIPLPWITLPQGVQAKGFVALAARSKYNVDVLSASSLFRDTPSGEEQSWIPQPSAGMEIYSLYRIVKFPFALKASLKLKESKIFLSLKNHLSLKENLFQIHTLADYEIHDRAITEVSFHLPSHYDSEHVRIEGDGVGNVVPPQKGSNLWKVTFQREILGNYQLKIFYERELKTLPVGELTSLPIFELSSDEGKRRPSYISLSKEGNVDFYFLEKNLKEIDVTNLPTVLRKDKTFKGYEILAKDFSLEIKAVKLQYAPVLNTVAEHLHLDTVVNQDGTIQNQFYLLLKNNGRQYLSIHLPSGFESLLLEVGGKPVLRPSQGKDKEEVMVNILENSSASADGSSERTVFVRGRYVLSLNKMNFRGNQTLQPPHLGLVPITLYTWNLYLPREYSYLEFSDAYVHKENNIPLLARLQNVLEGQVVNVMYQADRVDQLRSSFATSGFFQNIVLDGKFFEFYLTGTKEKSGPPPLKITYMGKKTTYFIHFIVILLTLFLVHLSLRFLRLSKSLILAMGSALLVLCSLIVSPAYQIFLLFSLSTLALCGVFWMGKFFFMDLNFSFKKKSAPAEDGWEKVDESSKNKETPKENTSKENTPKEGENK